MRIQHHIVRIVVLFFMGACAMEQTKVPDFSASEKEWLSAHPVLVFSVDNTYPPLNFSDELGVMKGLNVDLIRLVEKKLGVEIKLEGSDWNEALNKALNHRVDGVLNATPLEERKHRLSFSKAFFSDPLALVTHKDDPTSGFSDITYQRIAAKAGSRHLQLLKTRIPEYLIIEVKTLPEALQLLMERRVDGVFDDLAPLYHQLSSRGLSHLKVAFVENTEDGARIGLRNDDPVLLSVLNKAIGSISEDQILAIQDKWLGYSPRTNYRPYYITIGILLSVLLLIGLWSWSLKSMVVSKTAMLEQELKQRELVEANLRIAKDRAEESDRLKSAFLANISHEIRTPMNGIYGFSQILQSAHFEPEEQSRYLGLIMSSAQQLLSIINDIVHISKLEANLVEVNKSEVSVRGLLDDLCSVFKLQISESTLQLNCQLDELVGDRFLLDEVKVKQVLTNLLSNAFKNTEKGAITIGVTTLEPGMLRFYVKDTGVGIAKENHERIFSRFWKLENGSAQGGTGLGLAISKGHVELMQGRVWVESDLGKGATFYFDIPV